MRKPYVPPNASPKNDLSVYQTEKPKKVAEQATRTGAVKVHGDTKYSRVKKGF